MAIITKDDLKEYLQISNNSSDNILTNLSNNVSAAIERFCSRKFTAARRTEIHSGTGDSDKLFIENPPIVAISAIWDDPDRSFGSESLFATADYVSFASAGYIQLVSTSRSTLNPTNAPRFSKGVGNIRITYTAGYTTAPFDIVQAAILWAAPQWKLADQKLHGVSSIERGGSIQSFQNLRVMPPEVKELLKPYRVWNI